MVKTARIRNILPLHVYQDVITMYKYLLKEKNKDRLYFFKGLVYAAINHEKNKGCRSADDFLGEICRPKTYPNSFPYSIFESFYSSHKRRREKKDKDSDTLFGMNIEYCIKRTI